MQDPLLQLILEQRASLRTTRRPAPGRWNNLDDVDHERVSWLGAHDGDWPGQCMSLLLVVGFRGPLRGRTRRDDCDEVRVGSGYVPLSGGDIAGNLALRRLQCLEHHPVTWLDGQTRRQAIVPGGVDGFPTEVMRSATLQGSHPSSGVQPRALARPQADVVSRESP